MSNETVLCLDLGNSRLKWGICCLTNLNFIKTGVISGQEKLSESELDKAFGGIKVDAIWCSSVANEAITLLLKQWFEQNLDISVNFIETNMGVFSSLNAYQQPADLGVDRWLAMVAGRNLMKNTFCVVDAGTAITIDVVDAKGNHLGGMIMPGLRLMLQSLQDNTANIGYKKGEKVELANNTADGIESGVAMAALGGISWALELIRAQNPGVSVLLTGGDAEFIKENLDFEMVLEKNLVLRGVGLIARELYA